MTGCRFEIVTTSAGAVSIRDNAVNEIMHNPVGPWVEANDLYISQPRLKERLTNGDADPLVLFDVGLGAATNAIAAIHCHQSLNSMSDFKEAPIRPLHLISYEKDLTLLEFALENAHVFDHMRGHVEVLKELLFRHRWQSSCKNILWELREGDFVDLLKDEKLQPELVFFDPYSPAKNPEMWSLACFEDLYRQASQRVKPMSLFTYSVATPVRAAMLMAGFYVGYGKPTGLKEETTQAATKMSELIDPLNQAWWRRWCVSHKAFPYDVSSYDQRELVQRMRTHPQFVNFLGLREAAEDMTLS